MGEYFLPVLGMMTASILSVGTQAVASPSAGSEAKSLSVLRLKRDEAYARARPKLLRDGWQPVRSSGYRGIIDEILQAGWVEVSNCSGTGLGFCAFDWKRGRQCARIITYGEYLPERGAPKVYDAKVGSCAKVLVS